MQENEWWKDLKLGDYVVCIEQGSYAANLNYVYKVDNVDEDGWIGCFQPDGSIDGHKYIYYRIATSEEAKVYEHADNPVNVTTYKIPEEKPEFEVGKWYDITNDLSKYYVKVNKIEGDTIIGDFISSKLYRGSGGFFIGKITKSRLLTDLSEIQQYLPDGHVDKVVEFKLPEKWCILNIYPEVRKYLSEKYNVDVIDWDYKYIGWDGASCNNGVHGCSHKNFFIKGTKEITFDQFKQYVLKQESVNAVAELKTQLKYTNIVP